MRRQFALSHVPVGLRGTWQLVGIVKALSNGKLNQFLIYSFLLKVVHFYMKGKVTGVGSHVNTELPE